MRKGHVMLVAGLLCLPAACKDYLDVNTNPNAPQSVAPNLYLAPMVHWLATSPQYDGRFIGHFTQEWYSTSTSVSPAGTWGKMGYDPASDNGAQQWRDVYWTFGQNLVDMMTKAEAEQRWDVLGIGYVLKAWGWQVLTDTHGEIIIKEAIDPTRFAFDYDDQQFAYDETKRLLLLAISNLQRTDGNVDAAYVGKTDKMFNGDRTKWLKLAYGMLALNLNHYSNKAAYKPDCGHRRSWTSRSPAIRTTPSSSTRPPARTWPTSTSTAGHATTSRSTARRSSSSACWMAHSSAPEQPTRV